MSLVLGYVLPDPEHSTPARAFLVVGYAAWLWWRAGRQTRSAEDSFWWHLGATLLFLLALNKFFNLRLVIEGSIRALAKAGNWYERRQPAQFALAVVLPSILAVLTAIVLATKGRGFFRRNLTALGGWVLLLLYLSLRQIQEWKPALSLLRTIRYYDWRLILEIAGIIVVIFSAMDSRKRSESRTAAISNVRP
jgi:hypothetical protein